MYVLTSRGSCVRKGAAALAAVNVAACTCDMSVSARRGAIIASELHVFVVSAWCGSSDAVESDWLSTRCEFGM